MKGLAAFFSTVDTPSHAVHYGRAENQSYPALMNQACD
jgi:hypothetical protein